MMTLRQRQQDAINRARQRALAAQAGPQQQPQGGGDGGGGSAGGGAAAAAGGLILAPILGRLRDEAWNAITGPSTASGAGGAPGLGASAAPEVAPAAAPQAGYGAAEAAPYYAGTEAYPAMAPEVSQIATPAATSAPAAGATHSLAGAPEMYPAMAADGTAELGAGSLGSYAPYASLAAPALMTYLAYTAGSGRNDPVDRRNETLALANQIAQNRFAPSSAQDWHSMHYKGRGHNLATGDSGFSDAEIDQLLYKKGLTPDGLKAMLGLNELPDWSKMSYDTWFPRAMSGGRPIAMGGDPNNERLGVGF